MPYSFLTIEEVSTVRFLAKYEGLAWSDLTLGSVLRPGHGPTPAEVRELMRLAGETAPADTSRAEYSPCVFVRDTIPASEGGDGMEFVGHVGLVNRVDANDSRTIPHAIAASGDCCVDHRRCFLLDPSTGAALPTVAEAMRALRRWNGRPEDAPERVVVTITDRFLPPRFRKVGRADPLVWITLPGKDGEIDDEALALLPDDHDDRIVYRALCAEQDEIEADEAYQASERRSGA